MDWKKKEYVDSEGFVTVEHTQGEWSIFKRKKDKKWRLFHDESYSMYITADGINLRQCKKFTGNPEGNSLNRLFFKSND